MQTDTTIDPTQDRLSNFEVMRRIPAADALGLEIGVEAISERLVLAAVADEDRVVVDGPLGGDERADVLEGGLGTNTFTQAS